MGDTLHQEYFAAPSGTYPVGDKWWIPVSGHGGSPITGLAADSNVVILVGEAGYTAGGSADGGWAAANLGDFTISHYGYTPSGVPMPVPVDDGAYPSPTFYSTDGDGSGKHVWLPAGDQYSCAVVDHVFTGDFDIVISVDGHTYVAMGMGYGSGVQAGDSLHVGTFGHPCYAGAIDQWYTGFGLSYTGGYHWPYDGAGYDASDGRLVSPGTTGRLTYTRFRRVGNTLTQHYKILSRGADYPRDDASWIAVTAAASTIGVTDDDNVIILVGDAGRPEGGTGLYKIAKFGDDIYS